MNARRRARTYDRLLCNRPLSRLFFAACVPGFYFIPNKLCVRCPSDTYQEQEGQTKCDKCPSKKYTYGKTGMTSQSNCSGRMTNQYKLGPLQLHVAITWLDSAILESNLSSVDG